MGSYLTTSNNNVNSNNEETYELKKLSNYVTTGNDKQSSSFSQGFLYKQPTSLTKEVSHSRWKLRFFILKKLGLFYYHVNNNATYDLSLLTNVEMGELFEIFEGKSGYKMLFQFNNGYLLTMATPSKSLATLWTTQLRKFLDPNTVKEDCAIIPGDFVFVKDDYYKIFLKKFVTINFSTCEIIVQDMTFLGNFNLRQCEVTEIVSSQVPNENDGFSFSVVNKESGRTLTLGSGNEDAMRDWRKDIEVACAETDQSNMRQDDVQMVEFYNVLHSCFKDGEKWKQAAIQRRVNEETRNTISENTRKKPFLILSFDGGGTRGLIPCLILERLMTSFPDLLSKVSMVAGTSNGSLIAMALAFGHHPHTIREMTELTSKSVFSEQTARYTVSAAKWSNRYLSVFCKETWKDMKMCDAHIPCLVPSFCLNPMHVEIFTSFSDATKNTLVSDVTMKSCAAPTFFPAWKGSVDGGVFAHCPADLAITYAMNDLGVPLDDIYVLSFSTGTMKRGLGLLEEMNVEEENTHNYGYYQWASQLPSVIWEGMIEKSTILCKKLLKDRFCRIDPTLDKEYPLDNPEVLPEYHNIAKEEDLGNVETWLKNIL